MPDNSQDTSKSKSPELLNLIPKRKPLPGEDAGQLEDLHTALLLELAPSTPLQHVLAEDFFNILCDSLNHRRYHDALIRAGIRQLSQGAFHDGKIGTFDVFTKNSEAEQLGSDLVGEDKAKQQHALSELTAQGISIDELVAKAYTSVAAPVASHEAQIADLETRRRKLLEDYYRQKAAAAKPVEDAVLIEET